MSNPTVRAAAEGLPNVNRRRLMLGMAAASTAATALAVTLPALAAEHPDAELFRLDAEMDALQVRSDEIGRDLARIEEMAVEAAGKRPLHPSAWKYPSAPDDVREMDRSAVRRIVAGEKDVVLPKPAWEWHQAVAQEKAAVQAAWDEYDKRRASHERLLCRDAKDDDDQECSKAIWEIGRRIFAMPACTFQGMAVKLRAGERLGLEDFAENEAFLSIAADIRRLANGGEA